MALEPCLPHPAYDNDREQAAPDRPSTGQKNTVRSLSLRVGVWAAGAFYTSRVWAQTCSVSRGGKLCCHNTSSDAAAPVTGSRPVSWLDLFHLYDSAVIETKLRILEADTCDFCVWTIPIFTGFPFIYAAWQEVLPAVAAWVQPQPWLSPSSCGSVVFNQTNKNGSIISCVEEIFLTGKNYLDSSAAKSFEALSFEAETTDSDSSKCFF